jgi:predicted lipid-binding transport protein (Tim44 family)
MKRFLISLSIALLSLSVMAPQADAKRLGGGGSSGMQRTVPPRSAPTSPPPSQNATPPAAQATPGAAAPAAAPKRSWMGPLAGLAAGLGIAALMSHLGMGAEFGNIIMIALLAMVAFIAIRFVMSRFAPRSNSQGMQYAGMGAGSGANVPVPANGWGSGSSSVVPAAAVASTASQLPAGFDTAAFERAAKLIFIRMQAANDVADLNDLRAFTTPEMFAAVKLDLQERHNGAQQTDVVKLDAEVLDFAQEATQQIVSVRFHGLIREEKDSAASPFDEVWHLVKPTDGSREWAIAGIAPYA